MLFSRKRFIIIANARENVREPKNMKRCPQCNSVFDDSLVYCTNDGAALLEEGFVLPSENLPTDAEEEITVIRHDPITIDIPNPHAAIAPEQFSYQAAAADNIVPVIVEKRRNTGKYLLFLFLGLILGGGAVLALALFGVFLYQNRAASNTAPTNRNSALNSAPNKPSPTPLTASAKHDSRTEKADTDFNGRVIAANAYVRSSPNRNSKQIDILPIDDRLNIEDRKNPNSPWFKVTCEHGTSGWMHGNTIKFME